MKVRECKELEVSFETCFTEMITNKEGCSLREMKKIIFDVDRRMLLENGAGTVLGKDTTKRGYRCLAEQ